MPRPYKGGAGAGRAGRLARRMVIHAVEEGVAGVAAFGPAPRVVGDVLANIVELVVAADDVFPVAALPDRAEREVVEAVGAARDDGFEGADDGAECAGFDFEAGRPGWGWRARGILDPGDRGSGWGGGGILNRGRRPGQGRGRGGVGRGSLRTRDDFEDAVQVVRHEHPGVEAQGGA